MEPPEVGASFDAVIIGAGVSGMAVAHKLAQAGHALRVFERGTDVGGTWYWNRYPGCACDVESKYYSFSFDEALQRDWHWPLKYSTQPDILRYLRHAASRFGIYRHIRFSTEVTSCRWDEARRQWQIGTSRGDLVRGRHVVLAIGSLSMPQLPRECVEGGLATFRGQLIHTARWPEGAEGDLRGRRVGIIGTGATAVQLIPQAADVCERLYVFQRTPPSVSPQNNGPIKNYAAFKQDYARHRAGFNRSLEDFWRMVNEEQRNRSIMSSLHARIRKTVLDPQTAEALCPQYPFGCKRPCILDGFYETFNRPNVELVSVQAEGGVRHFGPEGPVVRGKTYHVDVLVFATGFDALGGTNFSACGVEGIGGVRLEEKFRAKGRPMTLYGVHTAGFPNLYIMQGPHSPSVLSNMIYTSECQADYVAAAVGQARVEATEAAEEAWVAMSEKLGLDKVQSACNNWYNKLQGRGHLQVYTGSQEDYIATLKRADFTGLEFVRGGGPPALRSAL